MRLARRWPAAAALLLSLLLPLAAAPAAGAAGADGDGVTLQLNLTVPFVGARLIGRFAFTPETVGDDGRVEGSWTFHGTVDDERATAKGAGSYAPGDGCAVTIAVETIASWSVPGVPQPPTPFAARVRPAGDGTTVAVTLGPLTAPLAIDRPFCPPASGTYRLTSPTAPAADAGGTGFTPAAGVSATADADQDASVSSGADVRLVTPDGQTIALEQPVTMAPAPVVDRATGAPLTPTDRPLLPPLGVAIDAIDLDRMVLLGDADNVPAAAVGWYFGSAYPGTTGNVVLFGHSVTSDGAPGVFARLAEVGAGAAVRVRTRDWVYVYVVDGVSTVDPTDVAIMAPTAHPTLTIYTCAGSFDPATGSFTARLVVRGHLDHVEPV